MVSLGVQVVIDCAEPHVLAEWWAQTMGWQVESQDATFIRSMVDQGYATEDETTTHRGALVWRSGAAIVAPHGATGPCPRILFVEVPEAKVVKNRMHLDLRGIEGADLDALRADVVTRGATRIGEHSQGPHTWVVFLDPAGNEFCA